MSWMIRFKQASIAFSEAIYIVSNKLNWNDFGFNYHASASFSYNGKNINIDIFVLPLDPKTSEPLNQLSHAPHGEIFFYKTILADPDSYRELSSSLSKDDYIFLLSSLHDLSIEHYMQREQVTDFLQKEPFRLGVLRYPSAYLSLINGYENSYTLSPTKDSKIPFSLSTLLPGTENFINLKVNYKNHEYFDDRVHCLIGVNGTGKTNLLTSLIFAASARCDRSRVGNNFSTKLYKKDASVTESNDSKLDIDEDFSFERVIAYYSDPSSTLPRYASIGAFEYKSFNTTLDAPDDSYHQNMSYLIVTLLRIDNNVLIDSKWNILKESLSNVIDMDLLAIPVTKNCPDYCCIMDGKGNKWSYVNQISNEQRSLDIFGTIDVAREPSLLAQGTRKIVALSSGQRSMFRFAIHFLTHAGFGTLLVIDEPESYLHPNLVSDYMMLLYKILKKTSSVALIATHSAYVVREIPTHCVHILSRKNRSAEISKTYLKTLGASVSEISLAVFGDSTVDAYHRKISEEIAKTGMSFDEIVEAYKDIFNIEMLMEIKDRISHPEEYK